MTIFLHTDISNCYRKHEAEKKRAYEQRIRDRGGTLNLHFISGKAILNILQKASLPSSSQVGSFLQLNTQLAMLPHFLFTTTVSHTKHQRCPLFSWLWPEVNTPCWPDEHWGTNWPEVTFWTHFSSLLVPCVYIFILPNTYSTCTCLQINFYSHISAYYNLPECLECNTAPPPPPPPPPHPHTHNNTTNPTIGTAST